MKRNDSKFKEMVLRIQSGELTRHEAAEAYGIGYGTLGVWLSRSKLNSSTARRKVDGTKARYGVASEWPVLDKDAVDAAVQRVLSGEISARALCMQDPTFRYSTLVRKVQKARRTLKQTTEETT